MLVLIIGGAASGKSKLAEDICGQLWQGEKAYIATMAVQDEESEQRVLKHREMRRDKGFSTIECSLCEPGGLLLAEKHPAGLLECISNLLANEMYIGNKPGEKAVAAICDYIMEINKSMRHFVLVSNDVFGDGAEYDPFTREYLHALAQINQRLAELADCVIEAVYGIPVYLKGEAI